MKIEKLRMKETLWLGKIELRQLPHLVGFNLVVALFSCTPYKFQ